MDSWETEFCFIPSPPMGETQVANFQRGELFDVEMKQK